MEWIHEQRTLSFLRCSSHRVVVVKNFRIWLYLTMYEFTTQWQCVHISDSQFVYQSIYNNKIDLRSEPLPYQYDKRHKSIVASNKNIFVYERIEIGLPIRSILIDIYQCQSLPLSVLASKKLICVSIVKNTSNLVQWNEIRDRKMKINLSNGLCVEHGDNMLSWK